MKKLNRKGFTLIEILVVVAIIGILAGVVLVGLRGTGPQARDSRRVADLRQVQNGLELFYNKNGAYPTSITDWAGLQSALIDAEIGVKNVPQDPQNTGSQIYFYGSDNGSSYVIGVTLEETDSKLLDGDIDDTAESMGCDDPIYCVQL